MISGTDATHIAPQKSNVTAESDEKKQTPHRQENDLENEVVIST